MDVFARRKRRRWGLPSEGSPMPRRCGVFLILAFGFFLFGVRVAKPATYGFTITDIMVPFAHEQHCVSLHDSPLLNTTFRYLGKGAQCVCFVSENGEYVVKFFRKNAVAARPLLSFAGSFAFAQRWVAQEQARVRARTEALLQSCAIANDDLADLTGVLAVHMPEGRGAKPTVLMLTDPLCIAHAVDVSQLGFIVQRRARPAQEMIADCLRAGDTGAARDLLISLLRLVQKRVSRGIGDTDPNFSKNFGFIDGSAVQIDIGRFHYMTSVAEYVEDRAHFLKKTAGFVEWLQQMNLELHLVYEREVSFVLAQFARGPA